MSSENRPSIFQKIGQKWQKFTFDVDMTKSAVKLIAMLAPRFFRHYSEKERYTHDDQQSSIRWQSVQ